MRGDLIMHFMSLGFHELMINGTLQFCLSQPRNRNSSLINHRQKRSNLILNPDLCIPQHSRRGEKIDVSSSKEMKSISYQHTKCRYIQLYLQPASFSSQCGCLKIQISRDQTHVKRNKNEYLHSLYAISNLLTRPQLS